MTSRAHAARDDRPKTIKRRRDRCRDIETSGGEIFHGPHKETTPKLASIENSQFLLHEIAGACVVNSFDVAATGTSSKR
jgi:hypothetical protein